MYELQQPKSKAKGGCISTIFKLGIGSIGLLILIGIVGNMLNGNSGTNPPLPTRTPRVTATMPPTAVPAKVVAVAMTKASTPIATSTPLPTPPPPPASAPSFSEIRSQMEVMTRAQWDAYQKHLKGAKVIEWAGWVIDTKSKLLGGYRLTVDMDDSDQATNSIDVSFDVSEQIALALSKSSPITFSGAINSVYNIFGNLQVGLIDVTVKVPPPTITPLPTNTLIPTETPLPTNTPLPTSTPLPTNTPAPTALPFNSGGLGQSKIWWDSQFGNGIKNGIGYTVYGDYEVMFSTDNVMLIDRQRETPVDQETILAEAALLIPADSQLIDTYSPSGRPEATVLLYMSESLKARFGERSFTGGEPGNFIVLFNAYEQGITRLIIATGNNP